MDPQPPQQPTTKTHTLYLDDSGEKEYGSNSQYFTYGGLIVPADSEAAHLNAIRTIKRETFGSPDVELKSNWMRIPHERTKRYLDPYGITEAQFKEGVERLYTWLDGADVTLVAGVIDKPQMLDQYKTPYHPSAMAYLMVLQRYQKFLAPVGGWGYVTVDDMDGASPKQNQWRELLRRQHRDLKANGCHLTGARFDNVAPNLRFADSAKFELVQVADLVAYNVLRQFRDFGTEWDLMNDTLPSYPYFDRIAGKFMSGPQPRRQIEGYGIMKWPRIHEGRWRLAS